MKASFHPFDPSSAVDVKALRERMGMTQRQFAGWFGFSVATLRHWERGNRAPTGTALVLLHVIRENPRVVLLAVRKARMQRPGSLAVIEELQSNRAPPGFGERPLPLWRRRHPDVPGPRGPGRPRGRSAR